MLQKKYEYKAKVISSLHHYKLTIFGVESDDEMSSDTNNITKLVDHLFRHESGKMISTLTRLFGSKNIVLAEDIVQDALIDALNQWTYKGIPDNPKAWVHTVAKNKALNIINREKYKLEYITNTTHDLKSTRADITEIDFGFTEKEISDDQLRMMFTCCHPAISVDSQIALTLKTLCGFGLVEIAKAFLTSEENIKKRLARARKTIREADPPFEVPQGKELMLRLDAVLETIYFLFNEGYSASRGDELIRFELCDEAIRLAGLISINDAIKDKSNVNALLALMFLNTSRFKARQDRNGNILQMSEQDRSLWDTNRMLKGLQYLEESRPAEGVSVYHILAAISAYHCAAPTYEATDWKSILSLYDKLLLLDHSPVVLLNRAIVVGQVDGPGKALRELNDIKYNSTLKEYYLLHATKAEFYLQINQRDKALLCYKKAVQLSALQVEKDFLQKKISYLEQKSH